MKTAKPNTLLNVAINVAALILSLGSLYLVSHHSELILKVIGVIVFSYSSNTLFALLHEAVHRVYSSNSFVNEVGGIINGAMFPTGLTFQRICHLGHHLRNRTDHEMFDMYYPDDNLFLKRAQFYSILTGIYWITIPIGWMIYLIFPWSYNLLKSENQAIKHTGAIMLHPFINHPKKWRIRIELLFVIGFQIFIFQILNLKFPETFLCYWVFGLVWGSLQYADHAWSPRDVLKGAWNLKTNPITRAFFLNYHYHQVHHMNPKLPWNHLPRHMEAGSPKPSFWKIYLEMWKGPKPALQQAPIPLKEVVDSLSDDEDLKLEKPLSCEWICFQQFVYFTKRHIRYGFIALALYMYSFIDWAKAKRLRHGFALLQWIDDLLDGDREVSGEPLEIIERLVEAIKQNSFNSTQMQILAKSYLSQFSPNEKDELLLLLQNVIEAMSFDRLRVRDQILLSQNELKNHFDKTFSASLDILLLSAGAGSRSHDLPEVIDLFMWSSIIRDLSEDTKKGLINIPKDKWSGDLKSPPVQGWLKSEQQRLNTTYQIAQQKLALVDDKIGKKVFKLFINSMKKYLHTSYTANA